MIHQTSVSIAPNALQPLQKLASPSENGFSEVDSHHFNKNKKHERKTQMATSEGRCNQIIIFRWFYKYFLTASFQAS